MAAADAGAPDDAELVAAVRCGDLEAYGLLYRRHAGAARTQAKQLVGSRPDAEDLVAEAFAKVLDAIRGGGGPDQAFRAYLLTTVRNTLCDRRRRDRPLEWTDDPGRYDVGLPWEDPAVAELEATLAARAFHRLPERWREVIWRTEVERAPRPEVASLFGLTPNGVAALAYRARERLRQAYLQEHVAAAARREHRPAVDHSQSGSLTPGTLWRPGRCRRQDRDRLRGEPSGCGSAQPGQPAASLLLHKKR